MKPTDVLRQLTKQAEEYNWLGVDKGMSSRQNIINAERVGQLVLRSSDANRELLKQLSSADISESGLLCWYNPPKRPLRKRGPVKLS